jgi:hypothetical protein
MYVQAEYKEMYQKLNKRIIFQSFGQERFLDAPTYTFLTSDTTILQFFLIIISQVSEFVQNNTNFKEARFPLLNLHERCVMQIAYNSYTSVRISTSYFLQKYLNLVNG